MSQPVKRMTINPETVNYGKGAGLWENDVHIFSRVSHGWYGRVERRAVLLQTHIHITR